VRKKSLYIIAEAGVNHGGNLSTALKLVDIAFEAKADCVKFQAFRAGELVTRLAEQTGYQKKNVKEKSQYEMLLKYELKEEEFRKIKFYCDKKNIDFLVTPFSPKWVRFLYDLGIKFLKIGSGNIRSLELLKEIGKTKLPVILSAGMSSIDDIQKALHVLRANGNRNLTILHCNTSYPVQLCDVNLFTMHLLKEKFHVPVGFSDHTVETITGQIAVAAGASMLEKHFTIDKTLPGPDHRMSLSPEELKEYIYRAREGCIICGVKEKIILEEEKKIKELVLTSLVSKRFIKKGEIITYDMLTEKRPSNGISPMDIKNVIGKIAIKDIEADNVLFYDYLG